VLQPPELPAGISADNQTLDLTFATPTTGNDGFEIEVNLSPCDWEIIEPRGVGVYTSSLSFVIQTPLFTGDVIVLSYNSATGNVTDGTDPLPSFTNSITNTSDVQPVAPIVIGAKAFTDGKIHVELTESVGDSLSAVKINGTTVSHTASRIDSRTIVYDIAAIIYSTDIVTLEFVSSDIARLGIPLANVTVTATTLSKFIKTAPILIGGKKLSTISAVLFFDLECAINTFIDLTFTDTTGVLTPTVVGGYRKEHTINFNRAITGTLTVVCGAGNTVHSTSLVKAITKTITIG
jgi:hypothetical protein